MLRSAPRGRHSGAPAVRCTAPRAAPRRYNAQLARECTIDRLSGNDTGIALLKLNRPAAKNAIGKVLIGQFQESLQEIQGDKSIRVVVLRSEVPGVFCAGADLKERASMSPAEVSTFVTMLRSTFSSLSQLPVPTIAAINGAALGGGLELALCCDMRIAGMDAKLGLPETKLAIIPGAGGSQRLPRLIGESKAKELIFTARALNPQEALTYGIVNYAVTGDASDKAIELAREILPQGPVALQAAKKSIDLGSGKDITSAMEIEKLCYAMVIPTKDRLEGLTAFREKRKPKYIGE